MDILIFGAGISGKYFSAQVAPPESQTKSKVLNIIALIDNDPNKCGTVINGVPVILPKDISDYSFDTILICTGLEQEIKDITLQLRSMEIPEEKISVLMRPDFYEPRITDSQRAIWLKSFSHYIYSHGIKGNVAECGVYKGEFSRHINKYFFDRNLYLFDTFSGFDEKDLGVERKQNNKFFIESCYNNSEMFSDTSANQVLKQMPYPENCITKEGWFPESAEGVNDTFCFVNLDMDLYASILAGLRFFWDKMNPKGVILIHDYFTCEFQGVKQALTDFEKEINRTINKFPIGDFVSIALLKDFD